LQDDYPLIHCMEVCYVCFVIMQDELKSFGLAHFPPQFTVWKTTDLMNMYIK
jgi:hypothetical protein